MAAHAAKRHPLKSVVRLFCKSKVSLRRRGGRVAEDNGFLNRVPEGESGYAKPDSPQIVQFGELIVLIVCSTRA